MANTKLTATERKVLGRKVKFLRAEGQLPANVYGKKVKSVAVAVALGDFSKVFAEEGETGLIDLTVGKEVKPVLISNVQKDPVSDMPIHVDFLQVDLNEKVGAQVPVELVGESPAEKQGLGTVVQITLELEVEALPANLPENFEIDVSILEKVDDAIAVKDIKVDPSKVEIKADPDQLVAKLEELREEEVAPAPAETTEEGAEGEKPSEGEEEKSDSGEAEAEPAEKSDK